MRISSAMMQNRTLAVENSPFYKKYKTQQTTPKDSTKPTETAEPVKIGKNTVVEKSGDKLVISRVDQNNKKSTLEEVDAKSESGKALLNLMNTSKPTTLSTCLNDMKEAKKTMNLTNYL